MDVPTLSSLLRPKLTVFFSETGETGDIYCCFSICQKVIYYCHPGMVDSIDKLLFSIKVLLNIQICPKVVSIGVFLSLFVRFRTMEYVNTYLSFQLVTS